LAIEQVSRRLRSSLRGSLFDNSRLPVAGRKSFPAENFEGTESVGGGENQAISNSVLSDTSRDVFARYVLWGTQEREASASKRSGSGCKTFALKAVHVELRIPHPFGVGVSTTNLIDQVGRSRSGLPDRFLGRPTPVDEISKPTIECTRQVM
jgi:hypothetical protein